MFRRPYAFVEIDLTYEGIETKWMVVAITKVLLDVEIDLTYEGIETQETSFLYRLLMSSVEIDLTYEGIETAFRCISIVDGCQ